MMVIDNKYNISDKVYLFSDINQDVRYVTAITIRQGGYIYELSCGSNSSWHYDFEISKEKSFVSS